MEEFVCSFKTYTKPGARATCCAFETPPRALAFSAAEAWLAWSGRGSHGQGLGARAAPQVRPPR